MFKKILAICQRELYSLFVSPIAFVVCSCFLFIYGYFFFSSTLGNNSTDTSVVTGNMTIVIFMLAPLISMKLISDEKKNKTLELLLTSPLSTASLVIGKFLAAMILFALILLLTLTGPLYLELVAEVHWPVIAVQYLGLFLMGSTVLGIGLVYSAVTENQIISGMLSVVTAMGLFLLSWITDTTSGIVRQVITELTILSHYSSFNQGIVNLKDIVYYLLLTVFMLLLAGKLIEDSRWKK